MRTTILFFAKQVFPTDKQKPPLSPQSSSGVIYDPSPANVINPQTATCLYNESGEKSILLSTAKVDRNLTKFWDLEAIGIKAESSCDPDDQAMQHFKSSVRFNSGRYEVGFPWKGHTQELNDNFSVAEKRVKSLTRRFIRDPTLYIQYSKF
ncbi:integrase catalytic domain-containing protein [Trichonephila clavipes]|nr:integrase catalytic domain-containing protein [Trichonephila clavipes]